MPSIGSITPAWRINAAIYADLQPSFVLCLSLIEAIENPPTEKTPPTVASEDQHNGSQNSTSDKATSTRAKLPKLFASWLLLEKKRPSIGPQGNETYDALKALVEISHCEGRKFNIVSTFSQGEETWWDDRNFTKSKSNLNLLMTLKSNVLRADDFYSGRV